MKVIVTGGAGFIGANLCAVLDRVDAIDEIVAIDTLVGGRQANLRGMDKVRLEQTDIRDGEALKRWFDGARPVVHLAARPSVARSIDDPWSTHDNNVNGTFRVLEAVRHCAVPHVIVASSSSVYGGNPTLPKHEGLTPMPLSPYASSKLAGESYALSFANSFSFRALAFRFFNVFGPLQLADHAYAAVIPVFIDSAMKGKPLPIHGDGEQTRDFTYVGDVAGLLAHAVVNQLASDGPVNLAFGTRRSLNDLVSILESQLGRSLERTHGPARVGDVRHSQADDARLKALFPDASPTDFAFALEQTVEWLAHQQAPER